MVKNRYFDCYLASLAEIVDSKKIDYNFLCIGKWDFQYINNEEKKIGTKIQPYLNNRKTEIFKEYYGIKVKSFDKKYFESIKEVPPNTYMLIETDLYDCNWTEVFHRNHFKHFFLLRQLNKDKYICDDPYFNHYNFICDKAQLKNLMNAFSIINVSEVHCSMEYIANELIEDAHFFCKNTDYLNAFINDMKMKFNIMNEIDDAVNDMYAIPILDSINTIFRKKKCYTIMLNNVLNVKDLELNDVYKSAFQCVEEWSRLKLIIAKSCLTKKDFSIKIQIILNNIYNKEIEFRNIFCKTMITYTNKEAKESGC